MLGIKRSERSSNVQLNPVISIDTATISRTNNFKEFCMKYFMTASSLPVTIWPLLGLAMANMRRGSDLDFSIIAISIPLMFGIANVVTSKLPLERTRKNMFLIGLGIGLIMATTGSIFHFPERVYGLQGNAVFGVLIAGPIFYALVWCLALFEVEKRYIS